MNKLNLNYIFYTKPDHQRLIESFLSPQEFTQSIFCNSPKDFLNCYTQHQSSLKIAFYYVTTSNFHIDIIKQLKKISFFTTIVLLLDSNSSVDFIELISCGIDDILEAPFYKSEFKLILEQSLKNKTIDDQFNHIFHVSKNIEDLIYFKDLQSKLQSRKSLKNASSVDIQTLNMTRPLSINSFFKKYSQSDLSSTTTYTMLIVEDNLELNNKLTERIKLEGHYAHSAFDYHDAVNKLLQLKPDFVFIDIALNGDSGEDLLLDISTYQLDCIPIVITAFNDNELILKCIHAGAYDFITKPFDPKKLISQLEFYILKKKIKQKSLPALKQLFSSNT